MYISHMSRTDDTVSVKLVEDHDGSSVVWVSWGHRISVALSVDEANAMARAILKVAEEQPDRDA